MDKIHTNQNKTERWTDGLKLIRQRRKRKKDRKKDSQTYRKKKMERLKIQRDRKKDKKASKHTDINLYLQPV